MKTFAQPIINILLILAAMAAGGCTGQLPGSFKLAQQVEAFNSQLQINTKIDLLWVIDNSSSMDVSQQKLRDGFKNFALKYMQPTWDIRVAVITTDMYLANPSFNAFLDQVIPGSEAPWVSTYMLNKTKIVSNPIYNPATHTFPAGVRYRDMVPVWGSDYARLIPGIHDGPIAALCFEGMPYFMKGTSNCKYRDDLSANAGVAHCLNPVAGESSLTECVNTVENDTVHSGKAIVSTQPLSPLLTPAAIQSWTDQLVADFMVNVTTGSAGFGSERGLGSILQLLSDNENTAYSFFRPGSLRGIVIVSDEDDQTMDLPSSPPLGFSPWTNYQCDQASLLAMNVGKESLITGVNGYCCSTPGNNCRYGAEGTSCVAKTVGGVTYTPSVCPRADKLTSVASVKAQLDSFFQTLDASGASGAANYFVASIVANSDAAITALQTARNAEDAQVGSSIRTTAVDRSDRYIDLGTQVGNGSMNMDISASDYSPILDAIGNAIILKKSVFTLQRAPTGGEELVVSVKHENGSEDVVPSSKYVVSGKDLVITDTTLVLGFSSTDTIMINYQPKTLY